MGESVRPRHRRARPAIGAFAGLALVLAGCAGGTADRSDSLERINAVHGTRPGPLAAEDVARLATALGIDAEVERTPEGWEIEDAVRTLYVYRTPSAWYAQYWDSSALLEPAGDRAAICAAADAPRVCGFGSSPLVVSVGAPPPTAAAADETARGVLERAGILDDHWRVRVLEPSPLPVPCPHELATRFDCNQQLLRTRAVVLETSLAPGATDVRWGIIVGPDGVVLTATGRIAERA